MGEVVILPVIQIESEGLLEQEARRSLGSLRRISARSVDDPPAPRRRNRRSLLEAEQQQP